MKRSFLPITLLYWTLAIFTISCTGIKKMAVSRDLDVTLRKSKVFNEQFTGFALYDPSTKEMLKTQNADLFFTPASNTKILTTYACLSLLPDSIPTFNTQLIADTLHISPFGDPTFLHPDFPKQPALKKLQSKPIQIHIPTEKTDAFGPGWAWDDYHLSFQPERNWFPIYANEIRITHADSLNVIPEFFRPFLEVNYGNNPGNFYFRNRKHNLFSVWIPTDTSDYSRKIPFETSDELTIKLLEDTLKADVRYTNHTPLGRPKTIYNSLKKEVLTLMMQRSDNFLAEQLLITTARYNGYSNVDGFRNYLIKKWELPDQCQWVDGSGLSRYNLFTPNTMVYLLDKIYQETNWEDLKQIFPAGGMSGTLRKWYGGKTPYVFAKTGTLSNNHCLSGYIVTNSGRILIFSFMNNNYMHSVNDVRAEMQKVLELIRDHY